MADLRPYRPSNGTEGACFQEQWCCQCERDREFNTNPDNPDPDKGCKILADTFVYDAFDPRYPKAWVYGNDGPMCTEFVQMGEPLPYRCPSTPDLFGKETTKV